MTNSNTPSNAVGGLVELAAACERATGPDRELDALICQAVELPLCVEPDCLPDVLRRCIAQTLDGSWPYDTDSVPAYTASLDAAVTLVPEGWDFSLDNFDGPHDRRCSAWGHYFGKSGDIVPYYAPTPALALCAASLRARHLASEQVQQIGKKA